MLKSAVKFPWVHVDWSMYVDEDEDEGDVDVGQNFNDFGGGVPEDEDSDDKEDISKRDEIVDHKHTDNCSHDQSNQLFKKEDGLEDLDKEINAYKK